MIKIGWQDTTLDYALAKVSDLSKRITHSPQSKIQPKKNAQPKMCSYHLLKIRVWHLHIEIWLEGEMWEQKYTSVCKALSSHPVTRLLKSIKTQAMFSSHLKADTRITREISCLLTCEGVDLYSL